MPKSSDRIRTPSFRAKMSALKGFSATEKALLQRIGNLVDVITLTQRQESNPGRGRKSRIRSIRVPTPKNIILQAVSGGVQVSWDPVDFSGLSFYEVQYSETSTFSENIALEVINNKATIKGNFTSGVLFIRVRSVSKTDTTSEWGIGSATSSSGTDAATSALGGVVIGTSINFAADGDFIDPENRTTVLPKPTLLSKEFSNTGAMISIGAHMGPTPITMTDKHNGFRTKEFERNEIAYDLYETGSSFPSREQRYTQNFGEYIDQSNFYRFTGQFYMRFQTLTNSITDFFDIQSGFEFSPTSFEVEFLRYRILNSFYSPEFPQAGIVLNSSLSVLAF